MPNCDSKGTSLLEVPKVTSSRKSIVVKKSQAFRLSRNLELAICFQFDLHWEKHVAFLLSVSDRGGIPARS